MTAEVANDMERALRAALAENQLSLAYQPKILLSTGRIVGVEALLRWSHPELGNVPPSEFIPVAEDSGLIVPIGKWVIEEACRQSARWQEQFSDRPALVTSVNVSTRQFSADLLDVVSTATRAVSVPASLLCLEVTESTLMVEVDAAIATLRRLAVLGVSLSIDDFGTGYSSLAYLKQFPLDELKVDKSFVDGLGHDPNDTAIVAAVVAMAHALGLDVVAEGVETQDQAERLHTMGCEQAQGYYFARPMPAEAIEELLRDEAAATWRDHEDELPRYGDRGSYRAERVLVVDDTSEVRQLARMSLATIGFDVTEATDGPSAIAEARSSPPDCILLDVVMPGMSGLEVCRRLRDDPATSNCTILMLTARADAADKVAAFSAGADDYIIKPFAPRDLTSRVSAAIGRRNDRATNRSST